MKKHLFLLLSAIYFSSSNASTARMYLSPMEDSKWELTQDTPLLCQIEHVIPKFGKAIFYQESGRKLALRFESKHQFKKDIDVSFRSVTANWKGIHTESNLAELKTSGISNPLLNIVENTARHAYFELQQGYQPSLFFVDNEDGFNSVSVILSTVRFRDVEADFGNCLTRLHPYHFEDVKKSYVHFEFDSEFPIEGEEDRVLDRMLDYLKLDDSINTIRISGHTDFKGQECYNETLSARRAWFIYDHLIQSGIEPRQLEVKFYGETRPLNKGKDDSARAMNRRVTVTLMKD